ncbi:MAG: glycerol-3-phosphate dehydrogenase [Acidimicrobiia bacterium]|nr:MAG: glycerol-3-phosphate dehydrogenase [Acidimicrobiia bacterium]
MVFSRADALRRLDGEDFDVLVVGGGITGAGVALDAASRGLRTALVERDDFASGTSSKSSKLVHGGIRYLQQKEIRLVYEALAERQVLRKTAPHLVRVLPFLLPVFTHDGILPRRLARLLGTTMWLYDLTGGARIGRLHRRVSKDEALSYMPTLPAQRLAASYVYYDAQADDARLTLAVARTAADHGAAVANYARLVGLDKGADGRVTAARVEADGRTIVVRARAVVNATGVWADDVRALDEGAHPSSIRPAKGVHLTVPWSLVRNRIAVVVPVPKDRRSVFVVPWGERDDGTFTFTYIGTTDTDYDGPLDDPQCTPDDVEYLLRAINASVTTPIGPGDVLGTWAGLRPLVRDAGSARTADLSRRHSVRTSPAGVVTVTGGKLTTYRRMAADAVDEVVRVLGVDARSRTKHLRLHGVTGWDSPDLPRELATRYGGDARDVLALARADARLGEPLVPGLPTIRAEVVYAARAEMARTVDDVLSRRTRVRILARDASAAAADEVAGLMAGELGWDEAERRRQAERYRAAVAAERAAAQLPETALAARLRPPS